jgi:CRISPR/Cas system-associated endonuclease Cas3-HD
MASLGRRNKVQMEAKSNLKSITKDFEEWKVAYKSLKAQMKNLAENGLHGLTTGDLESVEAALKAIKELCDG